MTQPDIERINRLGVEYKRLNTVDAFEPIVPLLFDKLKSFVTKLTVCTSAIHDVDDIVSESVFDIYENTSKYFDQSAGTYYVWCIGIARRNTINHIRNKKRSPEVSYDFHSDIGLVVDKNTVESECKFDDLDDTSELTCEIIRIINTLPSDIRRCVMMVCVEGTTYKQASESLGMDMNKVASKVKKAKTIISKTIVRTMPDYMDYLR